MPIPMREVTRRNRIIRARNKAEPIAADKVARVLNRRYKEVCSDLRRGNLKKRLNKILNGSQSRYARIPPVDGQRLDYPPDVYARIHKGIFDLGVPSNLTDWNSWIKIFADAVKDAFNPFATGIYDAEEPYWISRGFIVPPVNPEALIEGYQTRTGNLIRGVAEGVRDDTARIVVDWYNTDAGLRELIDSLEPIYGRSRAETIARTEATYLTSEVSLTMMNQFGVKKWIWDLADREGEWPCDICLDLADGGPYDVGDTMPPAASHPRCRCGVVYADENGDPFMYGSDD